MICIKSPIKRLVRTIKTDPWSTVALPDFTQVGATNLAQWRPRMATTTVQNFADHLEIQQVLNLYASALDKHQWSDLEQVFTEDAVADFIGIGVCEGRQAITELVTGVLTQCAVTQHLLGNYMIDVDGDKATASCYLSAMHAGLGDYAAEIFTVWGEYNDQLVRTADGWRIAHRSLTTMHASGDIGLNG
jgi:ketosteroid isomerase-like protein